MRYRVNHHPRNKFKQQFHTKNHQAIKENLQPNRVAAVYDRR
jgi:hypothetical protein